MDIIILYLNETLYLGTHSVDIQVFITSGLLVGLLAILE